MLFRRLYLVVCLALVAVLAVSTLVAVSWTRAEEDAQLAAFFSPLLEEAAKEIDAKHLDRNDDFELGFGSAIVPIDLLPLDTSEREALADGRVVLSRGSGRRFLYSRLSNQIDALEVQVPTTWDRWFVTLPRSLLDDSAGVPFSGELTRLERARLRFRPILLDRESLWTQTIVFNDGAEQRAIRVEHSSGVFRVAALCLLVVLAGFAIFLPIRPLDHQLKELSTTAKRFGDGETTARVARIRSASPLHDLVSSFNQMAKRIDDNLRDNELLMRSVSHELRTPLAKVLLALELLEEDTDAEREQRVDEIRKAAMAMQALGDELLDYARLGDPSRGINLEKIDLRELLDDAVARWPGTVLLAPEEAAWVVCDGRLIMRALENVIGNACRYAGPPRVRLESNSSDFRVYIEDDGPGVPLSEREQIFDPFYRLEDARRHVPKGLGLGLSITRRIVEIHGGRVAMAEADSGGAQLVLSLPRA
ncbi:MAG: ATP-binding protein [Myxococcota bacterium]